MQMSTITALQATSEPKNTTDAREQWHDHHQSRLTAIIGLDKLMSILWLIII